MSLPALIFWRIIRRMVCPACGKTIETERSICPLCRAPIRGQSRGKRVTQTRGLEPKYLCPHGIPLHWPCRKCERTVEGCAVYERSLLVNLQALLQREGISKSEAWARAKNMLAALDVAMHRPR